MRRPIIAALCLTLATALPASAQPTPQGAGAQSAAVQPSPQLTQRIDALPGIVAGTGDFDGYFSTAFKEQVPRAQFDALSQQIRAQYGAVGKVEQITATSPHEATVSLGLEKGVAVIRITVDRTAPHPVTGLLITRIEPRDDSAAKIEADFRALPGRAAYGVYRLGNGVQPVAELGGQQAMPLGSAFKLWVLAEAARQVQAGTRKWDDVVRLGDRSLSSGISQSWPRNAPVTLQTLATLMISISDNTATDTLLTMLGRDRVDAIVARTGTADPAATLPVLTTMEAFRLKSPANADILAAWKSATPDGRRKLLRDHAARLAATKIDPGLFGDKPVALDIEWFATPRDQAALLDWLRLHGGEVVHQIMAANPQTPSAAQLDYAGFKGGSEPGVIYGSWLVRTKKGEWYAVTGGWTRDDATVATPTFMNLMNRLIARVAAQ